MKRSFLLLGASGLFGFLSLTGCRATVAGDPDRPIKIEAHVTIDVRQIKEDARSIEDLVSGKGAQPAPKPHTHLIGGLVSAAWAQEGLSPELEGAINSRRNRYQQLKAFKVVGQIGEDNRGHVVQLDGGAEAKALVDEENRDREVIYQAQIRGKQLPPEAIATIRTTFAQEQRDRAEPGEKIQLPNGEWVTK